MTADRLRHAATLTVLVGLALLLRTVPSYPHVFTDGRVVFPEHDPWIHMRQVDNVLHHFPVPSLFDPYRLAPDGQRVAEAPLFDLLVAFPAWALGLGAPSAALADTVAAFVPPVLGALVVVPVYLLALALFGRWEAFFAGALVAVLPGTFLTRSRLGYTDHHVAEVLFLILTMLFTALALRAARAAA